MEAGRQVIQNHINIINYPLRDGKIIQYYLLCIFFNISTFINYSVYSVIKIILKR